MVKLSVSSVYLCNLHQQLLVSSLSWTGSSTGNPCLGAFSRGVKPIVWDNASMFLPWTQPTSTQNSSSSFQYIKADRGPSPIENGLREPEGFALFLQGMARPIQTGFGRSVLSRLGVLPRRLGDPGQHLSAVPSSEGAVASPEKDGTSGIMVVSENVHLVRNMFPVFLFFSGIYPHWRYCVSTRGLSKWRKAIEENGWNQPIETIPLLRTSIFGKEISLDSFCDRSQSGASSG